MCNWWCENPGLTFFIVLFVIFMVDNAVENICDAIKSRRK